MAKKVEISSKEAEKIKAGLDIAQLFTNIAISNERLRTILNMTIRGGEAGADITYGLVVLSAMNEMELIDMVVSGRFRTEATNYFNQVINERTNLISHWKGVGIDISRISTGKTIGLTSKLSLNSFSITNEVISILLTFRVLERTFVYRGMLDYFTERRNDVSHEEAWGRSKLLMQWAASNQLESQFYRLWNTWGPYTDDKGVTEIAKNQFRKEMGQLVVEAVGQQVLVEQERQPSLLSRSLRQFIDRIYGFVINGWDTIMSVLGQISSFGAWIGQQVGQRTTIMPIIENNETYTSQVLESENKENEPPLVGQVLGEEDENLKKKELQKKIDNLLEQIDLVQAKIDRANKEKEAQKLAEKENKEEEILDEKLDEKKEICFPRSININTASKEELDKIIGIGTITAQRIITARPFYSFNELKTKVRGIGSTTLQRIIAQNCAYIDESFLRLTSIGRNIVAEINTDNIINIPPLILAQNIILNPFFEKWEEATSLYWGDGINTKDIYKSTEALLGNYSLGIRHNLVGPRNIEQHTTSTTLNLGNPNKAYGEIRVKGKGYIRIGIKAGQTTFTHSDWEKIDNNDWVKIKFDRSATNTENVWEFRIQTTDRDPDTNIPVENRHRYNGIDLQIGAVWLGANPSPENWPKLRLPNPVNDFKIASYTPNTITLAWNVPEVTDIPQKYLSYKIYSSKEILNENNLAQASIASTTATSTLISGIDYNSTYYFVIKTFDGFNYSPFSENISFQTANLSVVNSLSPDLGAVNNGRKIARTSNGDFYVVYSRAGKIFLAHSFDQGINWTEISITPNENLSQVNPSIAIDSQDNLHIVWQGIVENSTNTFHQIRYIKYNKDPFLTLIIENLTNLEWDQKAPVIAINSKNNIHIVWVNNKKERDRDSRLVSTHQLLHRAFINQWEATEIIAESWMGGFSSFALVIDNQDNLHLISREFKFWDTGSEREIQYRKKTNQEWRKISQLIFDDFQGEFPSLVIDNQDNIHIVWHKPTNRGGYQGWVSLINYIKYNKNINNWEPMKTLSEENNNQTIASPSITLDSQGNIYVIWKRHNLKPISQIEYKNGSWQEIKELTMPFEWQGFPNMFYQKNQPKSGYAFIFYQGTNLKFYSSPDLTWE